MAVLAGEFLCVHCGALLRMQQRGDRVAAITCPECQTRLEVRQGDRDELVVQTASLTEESPFTPPRAARIPWGLIAGAVLLLIAGSWWVFSAPDSAPVATVPEESVPDVLPDPDRAGRAAVGPVRPPSDPAADAASAAVEPADKLAADPFAQRLGQLGRLVEGFTAERGTLPPALWEPPGPTAERPFSWLAGLDPAVSRDRSLLPQWNLPWDDALNDRFVRRKREELLNPAMSSTGSADRYPASHVVGIAGVGPDAAGLSVTHPRAGAFGWNRSTRVEDVTDGLSQTLLAAGVTGKFPAWADGRAAIRPLTQEPFVNGPDGFGSGQKSGMPVLMADGSVRFLSAKTDPAVVRRMATIAEGIPVDRPDRLATEPENHGDRNGTPLATALGQNRPQPPQVAPPPADNSPLAPAPEMNVGPPNVGPPLPPEIPKPDLDFEKILAGKLLAYELAVAAPLDQVLAELEALLGVRIEFDENHIPSGDPGRRQPVSLTRKNITFRDLLQDLLKSTAYTFETAGDHLLIIPRAPEEAPRPGK